MHTHCLRRHSLIKCGKLTQRRIHVQFDCIVARSLITNLPTSTCTLPAFLPSNECIQWGEREGKLHKGLQSDSSRGFTDSDLQKHKKNATSAERPRPASAPPPNDGARSSYKNKNLSMHKLPELRLEPCGDDEYLLNCEPEGSFAKEPSTNTAPFQKGFSNFGSWIREEWVDGAWNLRLCWVLTHGSRLSLEILVSIDSWWHDTQRVSKCNVCVAGTYIVCCSVLQCVAVRVAVCVAVCCSHLLGYIEHLTWTSSWTCQKRRQPKGASAY